MRSRGNRDRSLRAPSVAARARERRSPERGRPPPAPTWSAPARRGTGDRDDRRLVLHRAGGDRVRDAPSSSVAGGRRSGGLFLGVGLGGSAMGRRGIRARSARGGSWGGIASAERAAGTA